MKKEKYEYIIGQDLLKLTKKSEVSLDAIVAEMDEVYEKMVKATFKSSKCQAFAEYFTEWILNEIEDKFYEELEKDETLNPDEFMSKYIANNQDKFIHIRKRNARIMNAMLKEINKETKLLNVKMTTDNKYLIGTLKNHKHEKIRLHFTDLIY